MVLVYDLSNVTINEVLAHRSSLELDGRAKFGLPFDICLLTEQEAQGNPFLEEENAILVYSCSTP